VRISSRTLLEDLFVSAGVARDRCQLLYALLDKQAKIPEEEFDRELAGTVPDQTMRDRLAKIFAARTLDEIAVIAGDNPSVNDLRRLFEKLTAYGFAEFVVFDINVVRGLAYYTGIVFEVFDRAKSLRAIAGGGRYDRLVELYGGEPTPAVGFAAGDVVLAELLKAKGIAIPHPPRSTCYIVSLDDVDSEVIAVARELRNRGISCEFPLKNVAIGKQLKNANTARSDFALFIGGDEGQKGMVKVKNMKNGEETLVSRNTLVDAVAVLLAQCQARYARA
jgi:histidyl-tRNA synthetase